MKAYQEIRLGRTRQMEVLIGSILGAAAAAGVVWFATVLVFSLA